MGAAVGSDGQVYVMGGACCQELSWNTTTSAYVYNPSSNAWTTLASMPTARSGLGVATGSDGRIYAIGGCGDRSCTPLNVVQSYGGSAGPPVAIPASQNIPCPACSSPRKQRR